MPLSLQMKVPKSNYFKPENDDEEIIYINRGIGGEFLIVGSEL